MGELTGYVTNIPMSSPHRFFSLLSLVALTIGCRKEQPAPKVTPAPLPSLSVAAAASSPAPVVPVKPTPPAPPVRKPTPLDADGLRTAKTYLAELSGGRKATVAKDYEQAEAHFSKSLEALPGDPRALGERGYARLLAGKLPEAEADLAAATRAAPSSAVLAQILHNRMLVARKRGDEATATAFEAAKAKAKAARRLPGGLTCESDVTDSDLKPQVTGSLDEALKHLLVAHAAADAVEPSAVQISPGAFGDPSEADQLKSLAAKGPLPDGNWQLWSSGSALRNHALLAHGGKLYGFPNQSSGGPSICGLDQAAELTIGGGGARPWYIQRSYRQLMRNYTTNEDSGQTLGYCVWTSTKIDFTILDSTTFEGIRTLSASAQPSGEKAAEEPTQLLELEWQADKVIVDACGQRSVVRYASD